MKQPEFFMDVCRNKDSNSTFNSGIYDFIGLDVVERWLKRFEVEMVAIWKIYPKKAVT